jgi:LacI family transcriptional regulator
MTTIFAANDEIAIAALAPLHDNGLEAPDDIAIVSIDNTKISSMVRPALTTVNIPISEMGEYALKMLISQREHALDLPMSMALPIELVVRESCGSSKTHHPNTDNPDANR